MKMERSLQPQSQTTDRLASLHPVPTAAGRMLVFMRISTDACQTGTDSIKWPSERFHEHQEATVAETEHKNSIRQASKRTFPPEAAERRMLKITGVGSKALQMFNGTVGAISAGIGYLAESRGRKERGKWSNGK